MHPVSGRTTSPSSAAAIPRETFNTTPHITSESKSILGSGAPSTTGDSSKHDASGPYPLWRSLRDVVRASASRGGGPGSLARQARDAIPRSQRKGFAVLASRAGRRRELETTICSWSSATYAAHQTVAEGFDQIVKVTRRAGCRTDRSLGLGQWGL